MIMPGQKTLDDLFLDKLKDIYYADKQILKALPKIARATQFEEGRAGFLQHRDETQGQVERLEQVFEMIRNPHEVRRAKLSRESSLKARRLSKSLRAPLRWTPA